jgi:hypothetical protein
MPPELLQSARERAAADDRTLAATVRVALRDYLEDDRQPAEPEPEGRSS